MKRFKFDAAIDPTNAPVSGGAPVQGSTPAPDTTPKDDDNVVVRIASINVYKNESEKGKSTTIYLRTNKMFKSMERGEDMVFREVDTNTLTMSASQLFTLLMEDFDIAFYLNGVEDKTDEKMLGQMLTFADLVFENKKKLKGTVVDGAALDRDKYFKTYLKLEPNEKALKKMGIKE